MRAPGALLVVLAACGGDSDPSTNDVQWRPGANTHHVAYAEYPQLNAQERVMLATVETNPLRVTTRPLIEYAPSVARRAEAPTSRGAVDTNRLLMSTSTRSPHRCKIPSPEHASSVASTGSGGCEAADSDYLESFVAALSTTLRTISSTST